MNRTRSAMFFCIHVFVGVHVAWWGAALMSKPGLSAQTTAKTRERANYEISLGFFAAGKTTGERKRLRIRSHDIWIEPDRELLALTSPEPTKASRQVAMVSKEDYNSILSAAHSIINDFSLDAKPGTDDAGPSVEVGLKSPNRQAKVVFRGILRFEDADPHVADIIRIVNKYLTSIEPIAFQAPVKPGDD